MYIVDKIEKKKKRAITLIKIFNILIFLIIIPILIYNITLIIKYIQNPNKTPGFFGFKTYEIVSRSMEDTINKNDIIIVKKVDKDEINENDIISFDNGREIITHRIVDIENINGQTLYTTKGDNNKFKDNEKVSFEQIEGKYVFRLSKFGYLLNCLKNRYFLVILLIILILCFVHAINIKKRIKIREEKRWLSHGIITTLTLPPESPLPQKEVFIEMSIKL